MAPLKIFFEKGLIETRKEDAIVNSTDSALNLRSNPSARAVAAAAGHELQVECSSLGPLKKGEVKVSGAHKLPCKRILHCWINSVKDLEKAITECLEVADRQLKFKSLAFPVLGTGVLGFPAEDVARYFLRCTKRHSSVNLKEIYVIIFPNDHKIYQAFLMVFKQHNESHQPQTQHFMDLLNGTAAAKPLVTLHIDSQEYMQVEDNFKKTIPLSSVTILEIKRIQNLTQWKMYQTRREEVSKKCNRSEKAVERILWHGTSEEAVTQISEKFFNRSYAGMNEAVYGNGTYFALEASYSHQDKYSKPNTVGEKYLLLTRVVIGKYAQGERDLKVPPKTALGEECDSAVNNIQNPSIFVVFNDAAAYPEYIIKYKKDCNEESKESYCNIL